MTRTQSLNAMNDPPCGLYKTYFSNIILFVDMHFRRCTPRFLGTYVTLLDCICTYLIGADIVINQKTSRRCKYCTALPELGHDEKNLESCWQACKLGDPTVFYNAQTGECFRPPCKWQRYWYYNVHGRKKFWWCCSNRWFFEPS